MNSTETKKYHTGNHHAWNQAAAAYRRNMQRTVDLLKAGGNSMCAPELLFLRDLESWCDTAIHLQCAGGEDSLSLLNLGAHKVVGIDISEEMIEVAQTTSKLLNAKATWICCDVLDVPATLDGTADLLYTGRGAIIWIHDLNKWANTVARLLKPDGTLYLYEGHPITYFFDTAAKDLQLDSAFDSYFSNKVYSSRGWTAEYIGGLDVPSTELGEKHERAWPASEVITALLDSGLRLERFQEHPDAYWAEFPNMSDSERRRFPNTYSLLMRKGSASVFNT